MSTDQNIYSSAKDEKSTMLANMVIEYLKPKREVLPNSNTHQDMMKLVNLAEEIIKI